MDWNSIRIRSAVVAGLVTGVVLWTGTVLWSQGPDQPTRVLERSVAEISQQIQQRREPPRVQRTGNPVQDLLDRVAALEQRVAALEALVRGQRADEGGGQ